MKSSLRFIPLLLAFFVGVGGSLLATHATVASAQTAPADSVTVFIDATFGFRKNHMANQLTKSHAEYAAKGYHFAAMAPYTENGDMQGFFVTYTRD